jgi:hypothetical protein
VGAPSTIEIAPEDVERWPKVLERIRAEKPALAASLNDAVPSVSADGGMSILVPNGSQFHRDQLQDRGNMALMERAATEVFGARVSLGLAFGRPPETGTFAGGDAGDPRVNEAAADPVVRKVLEVFDGEIKGLSSRE